jgi:hypothetical protein
MKDNNEQEEIYFRELMSKSKLKMPFSDFEDNVMMQIERKIVHQQGIAKDIKLSWLFFVVGTTFGIMISWILPRIPQKIFGIDPKSLAICFQIIFVVLIFTQIEALLGFFKKGSAKT